MNPLLVHICLSVHLSASHLLSATGTLKHFKRETETTRLENHMIEQVYCHGALDKASATTLSFPLMWRISNT